MKQNCHDLENMFLHLLWPTSSKISQYHNVDHYLLESYALHEKMCQDSLKLSQSIEEAKMFRMDYSMISKNVIPVTIKQILSCLRNFVDVFERYISIRSYVLYLYCYTLYSNEGTECDHVCTLLMVVPQLVDVVMFKNKILLNLHKRKGVLASRFLQIQKIGRVLMEKGRPLNVCLQHATQSA